MTIPRCHLFCRLAGGDGNCQFRAVSFSKYGTEDLHLNLRSMVAKEMKDNDEFYEKFKCHGDEDISKPGTWGGEASLVALAKVTLSKVVVYKGWKVIFAYDGGDSGDVYLEFTGNHYNCLVKKKPSNLYLEKTDKQVDYLTFEKPKKPLKVKHDIKKGSF